MNTNEKEILDMLNTLFPDAIEKVETEDAFCIEGTEVIGDEITIYLKNGKVFKVYGTDIVILK